MYQKISKSLKYIDGWLENVVGYHIYSVLESYLHLVAILIAVGVFSSGWLLSETGNIFASMMAAIVAFIAVINLLPLRAEFRKVTKQVEGFISPPFIDYSDEDANNKITVEKCLGKDDLRSVEMILTKLHNCNLSESELDILTEKLHSCLNGQQCDHSELPAEQIKCMTNRLIKSNIIILIFICNNDMEWLERRLSLYKIVGITNNNNILGKVIVCTNMAKKNTVTKLIQDMIGNKTIKDSGLGIFISDKDLNCDRLARYIDRKRYLDNKLREKQESGSC
jgi:hypothetical protein